MPAPLPTAACLPERTGPLRVHSYLFLLGGRTRQAGPGARGPHPILWSLGFLELQGSPLRLCFREKQQALGAPGALDNLPT